MGTKNNPGQFDCYAAAAPDEPMFVLLGRDKHAAGLVRLWALLRIKAGEDPAKVAEAFACADAMDRHAVSVGKVPDIATAGEVFEPLYVAATKGLDEHPENFQWPCECDTCLSYGAADAG